MENISSATKKIDFDKESGIDRSLLQVIHISDDRYIKYIFVGDVDESIRKILNKFENNIFPQELNKREKDLLEEYYGLNWDRKLGFNTIHKYKFLPIGEKTSSTEMCINILEEEGIYNMEEGYKWIKKNYESDNFYNIAGCIYKIYGKEDKYYEDNLIKKISNLEKVIKLPMI